MKIDKIDKTRLRNDEHFQFNTEFRDLVTKEGAQNLKVETLFAAYLPLYAKEDEGIKRVSKSIFTAKIHEADKARDEICTGMMELNEASTKHYSQAISEAAKKLKILFDTYGNISQKPLNEQTSAVYNILQELKGDYAEAAQTVGISGWATELEARNNAFEALVKERYDEAATKTDVVVKSARAELDAAYDAIVERVNAYAVIEGGELYERFARTFNSVISKYNAIANARHGRRNHKPIAEIPQQTEVLMNKVKFTLLAAGLALAMTFTFSCSSGDDDDGDGGGNSGGYTGSYGSVSYGGKTYKTVNIGTQTWMAENLNYDPGTGNSACYDNQTSNCATYGRLYDWSTAMGFESSCNPNSCSSQIQSKHRGVCPSGWHLPSDAEWDVLMTAVGGSSSAGTKLKAANGWSVYYGGFGKGTDDYGFSALPGGIGYSDGLFFNAGSEGNWWSASESEHFNNYAYYCSMRYSNENAHRDEFIKGYLFSVRCVQD